MFPELSGGRLRKAKGPGQAFDIYWVDQQIVQNKQTKNSLQNIYTAQR